MIDWQRALGGGSQNNKQAIEKIRFILADAFFC